MKAPPGWFIEWFELYGIEEPYLMGDWEDALNAAYRAYLKGKRDQKKKDKK